MKGTSSLTAYAGQVVTLSGVGSLTAYDFDALLSGYGHLTILDAQLASSTMGGTSYFYANAIYYYGRAQLPALNNIGRDAINTTSQGTGDLPSLTSSGEAAGSYDPEDISIGYGNLQILASDGIIIQSDYGEGDPDLPVLLSKGGDYVYGESLSYLQSLIGLAGYSNPATGFIQLKNVVISGELLNDKSYYATGELSLPKLKIEGYSGSVGDIDFPSMQVDGVGSADHIGNGVINFRSLIVDGVADFIGLSNGDIILPKLVTNGTSIFVPNANGTILLQAFIISGEGNFSPLGDKSGDIILPKLIINGIINNPEDSYIMQHERNPSC